MTRRTDGELASVPFFKRAIALDPEFALAYARLGTVYSNVGEGDEARRSTELAYALRERVSERERFYIVARYHTVVDPNLEQAAETYRLWTATYPSDHTPYVNLAVLLRREGRQEEAITALLEAIRLAPQEPLAHLNLGQVYLDEGRFDEARAALEEVLALQESTAARVGLVTLGTLTRDDVLVESQAEAVRGRRDEPDLLGTLAGGSMYWGRMALADQQLTTAIAGLEAGDRLSGAAEGVLKAAIAYAMVGRADRARAYLGVARDKTSLPPQSRDEQMVLATLLRNPALFDAAQPPAGSEPAPPDGLSARAVRAMAAEAAGQSAAALEALGPVTLDTTQPDMAFLHAWLALNAERYDEAVVSLEWLREKNGSRVDLSPDRGIERLMLARAYAGAGRIADARAAYEAFFEFWSDADDDLPVMVEARQEYELLKIS